MLCQCRVIQAFGLARVQRDNCAINISVLFFISSHAIPEVFCFGEFEFNIYKSIITIRVTGIVKDQIANARSLGIKCESVVDINFDSFSSAKLN